MKLTFAAKDEKSAPTRLMVWCRDRGRAPLAAASVFVLVLYLQFSTFNFQPSNYSDDFIAYVSNALSLAHGTPYGMPGFIINPHRPDTGQGAYPPGYPIVLAPVAALAHDPIQGAAYLNCLLYAAFAGLLVLFALPATGLAGAIGAGLVAGASPMFLDEGILSAPSEPLFLLLLMAAFLSDRLFDTKHPTGRLAVFLVGAAIAAASLVRVTSVVLGPAVIVADLGRRRRITWRSMFASAVAALLFLGLMKFTAMEYLSESIGLLDANASQGLAAGTIKTNTGSAGFQHLQNVLRNLVDMPGYLTTLWTFPGHGALPATGLWNLWRKLCTLPMLALALLGFVAGLRRRVSMSDAYFILQILLLVNLGEALRSPRYWLPVSVLTLVYAIAGAQLLGRFMLRRAAFHGTGASIGTILAVMVAFTLAAGSDFALAGRVDSYSLTEARSRDAFHRIAAMTAANAVIVSRRPRTIVFFTGRSAIDYHLVPSDPAFWPWAASVHATHLLLSFDQPEVLAIAAEHHLPVNDAGLTLALDQYEQWFLGAERARMLSVFDNGRYRLYQLHP